eukprot:2853422-Rhodomonas_salina.1
MSHLPSLPGGARGAWDSSRCMDAICKSVKVIRGCTARVNCIAQADLSPTRALPRMDSVDLSY